MGKIKTVYVIHHSHTDIGYTDLQERVIDTQVDYIHSVLQYMKRPELADFRWNCETLYCAEKFFETASEEEKKEFYQLAAKGQIGLSANYLNFNDLLDSEVFDERLGEWVEKFRENGVRLRTAMFADINGVSMGYRNALIRNGVEFLYMNIHCHHGMYPLYQNQTAYRWENAEGKSILVWNGEHYNLGNVLGLQPKAVNSYMQANYLGKTGPDADDVENLHSNLVHYLTSCEEQEYKYNFIITSVSGVFSDNAPPNPAILQNIEAYNERYGNEVRIQMVSLQELYDAIKEDLADVPVCHGDLNDWWANGVGSTPYAVKHYLEARHRYHFCRRLDPDAEKNYPEDMKTAQDNLLLYAEHTWGHSSTCSNPYDTMVLNLDMRKNSYASKAHEASSHVINQISRKKGDILRYYNVKGRIRAVNMAEQDGIFPVEFYIETMDMPRAGVKDADGRVIPCQVSAHPRGRRITFIDFFKAGEEKEYTYERLPEKIEPNNTRRCYVGAERVRDIVNDYDPETYKLPYGFETKYFRISYETGKGITSLIDKRTGEDLAGREEEPLFAPIYELTPVDPRKSAWYETPEQQARRLLGRNMRGTDAKKCVGNLVHVEVEERGEIFTVIRFVYKLEGTVHADVVLKMFRDIPRIDIRFELGKTISTEIESIYLPVGAKLSDGYLYVKKGEEAFRPGIDQVPGTNMEFTMSDDGIAYISPKESVLLASRDVPLFFTGELKHHPIRLCDGNPENNQRPVYSWVMNNIWETNFKMDLSGFSEYDYTLWLSDEREPEKVMTELTNLTFDPYVLMLS